MDLRQKNKSAKKWIARGIRLKQLKISKSHRKREFKAEKQWPNFSFLSHTQNCYEPLKTFCHQINWKIWLTLHVWGIHIFCLAHHSDSVSVVIDAKILSFFTCFPANWNAYSFHFNSTLFLWFCCFVPWHFFSVYLLRSSFRCGRYINAGGSHLFHFLCFHILSGICMLCNICFFSFYQCECNAKEKETKKNIYIHQSKWKEESWTIARSLFINEK